MMSRWTYLLSLKVMAFKIVYGHSNARRAMKAFTDTSQPILLNLFCIFLKRTTQMTIDQD